jgi:hypothetical protein
LKSINSFDSLIWSYIFQLESVRATQVYKLILTKDKIDLVSSNLFWGLKFYKLDYYKKYTFKVFLAKSESLLKDVIRSFPSFISGSVLSIDLFLSSNIFELKRKIDCFYEVFGVFSKEGVLDTLRNPLTLNSSKGDFYNKSIILFAEIYNINNRLRNYKVFNKNNYIGFYAPISYIYEKFRILGFAHPVKRCPIGNSKVRVCLSIFCFVIKIKSVLVKGSSIDFKYRKENLAT